LTLLRIKIDSSEVPSKGVSKVLPAEVLFGADMLTVNAGSSGFSKDIHGAKFIQWLQDTFTKVVNQETAAIFSGDMSRLRKLPPIPMGPFSFIQWLEKKADVVTFKQDDVEVELSIRQYFPEYDPPKGALKALKSSF
jgi:hypothetical protein